MTDINQPIVIDNGTGIIKTGFAGSDKPKSVFRSCVGRIKHLRVMPGGSLEAASSNDGLFIGNKVEEHRGALKLNYPIDHGIIQNWSDMERIWSYVYSKDCLNIPSENQSVLLTEPPLNPYSTREKTAEIFFEGLNVPGLYFAIQAILSLYSSGRTTGIVLDSGDGVTHVVPVYEGLTIPHAIMRMDLGGRNVTEYLQKLLRRNTGYSFHTSSEFEIVRTIKEQCCSVVLNPNKLDEFSTVSSSVSSLPSSTSSSSNSSSSSSSASSSSKQPYKLPDGSVIDLGNEISRAPELLFSPSLLGYEYHGIHDLLISSVMRCDIDLRRVLLSSIVLSGGSTLFPGYGERLLSELRRHPLTPKEVKIRIAAPPERLYSTWIGGSILASLSTFKNMWITKNDYLEHGARIFTTKLL
jgi:centractin